MRRFQHPSRLDEVITSGVPFPRLPLQTRDITMVEPRAADGA